VIGKVNVKEVILLNPLIVYYSYSGITRRLAEDIALITDGDLRERKDNYSVLYAWRRRFWEND